MTPENVLSEMNRYYKGLFHHQPDIPLLTFFSRTLERYLSPSISVPQSYLKQLMRSPTNRDIDIFLDLTVFSRFICTFKSVIKKPAESVMSRDPFYVCERDATRLTLDKLLKSQWTYWCAQHNGTLNHEQYLTIDLLVELVNGGFFSEGYLKELLQSDDPRQYIESLLTPKTSIGSCISETGISLTTYP